MGSQVSAKTNDKEQQLKKASKMAMVRALLPIVGLVVIFLLFNVLTDFRMMGNMSLAFSQVYVTMIAAMGVFFIMTMGGLDFSQGSILGIASIVVCILSKHGIAIAILGGIASGVIIGAINWGLIGFLQFDLVRVLFGDMSLLSRIIYAAVGIGGLYAISYYGRIRSQS